MLSESEYNQDHRTWKDSSSALSHLFVGINMAYAIQEDSAKCVSPMKIECKGFILDAIIYRATLSSFQ